MSPVPQFAPAADHPLTAPFWEAAAEGRLALPACSVCGAWQWYPVAGFACHPEATHQWKRVAGTGTIFTFTRVERAFLPEGGDPPYTLALVDVDGVDGSRIVTVLIGPGSDQPAIGDRVRLSPTPLATHTLPTFELTGAEAEAPATTGRNSAMSQPPGTRLRCAVCGSETIVVKSQDPELECCGQALEVIFSPPAAAKG